MQDVLELLVGRRASSSGGSSGGGSTAAASAAASAASSNAAAVALRGCLGTVRELVKTMELSKKEIFQSWQVWGLVADQHWCCAAHTISGMYLQEH